MNVKSLSRELYDAATARTLLSGLEHARSFLDVAILFLRHYANIPPERADDNKNPAEEAEKTKKLLEASGRPMKKND